MDIRAEDNLRLVHSVLKNQFHMNPSMPDYEDYFQQGCEGLLKAIKNYNPEYGTVFSTYAVPMIRGCINLYRRDYQSNYIHISRSIKDLWCKARRMDGMDDEEICQALSIMPEQLAECRNAFQPITSMDYCVKGDDNETPLGELIPDKHDMEDEAVNRVMTDQTRKLLSKVLTNTQMTVLQALTDGKTQEEAGWLAGVSQVHVSRIMRRIESVIAPAVKEYLNGNKKPLLALKKKEELDMGKLSDKHIEVITNWMKEHPKETPNVTGLWKENGLEVLKGYQTVAKKKAYALLVNPEPIVKKPDEVLKTKTTIVLNEDGTAKSATMQHSVEPKAENLITNKGMELLEKARQSIPTELAYTADLTPESVQNIAKSLQGMAYTAQLMGKGATVTISVEMGV